MVSPFSSHRATSVLKLCSFARNSLSTVTFCMACFLQEKTAKSSLQHTPPSAGSPALLIGPIPSPPASFRPIPRPPPGVPARIPRFPFSRLEDFAMSSRQVIILGTEQSSANAHAQPQLPLPPVGRPGYPLRPRRGHAAANAPGRAVRLPQITHICVTHFHGDHCLGLAGIIQRLSLDRVPHPVEVIYPASGQVFFERLRHASAFFEVAELVPRPVKVLRRGAGRGAEVRRVPPADPGAGTRHRLPGLSAPGRRRLADAARAPGPVGRQGAGHPARSCMDRSRSRGGRCGWRRSASIVRGNRSPC